MPEPDGPPVMDYEDLGELLRREAGLHRPDPERILARVQQARSHAGTGREPVRSSDRRRPRVLVQVAGAAAAAAALVVSVTGLRPVLWGRPGPEPGATVTMAGSGAVPGPAAGGDGAAPAATSPAGPSGRGRSEPTLGSAVATTQPRPDGGAVAITTAPSRSTEAPSSRDPRAGNPPPGGTSLQLSAAGAPSATILPGAADVDWVVVGARKDGKQIRAKRGTGAVTQVTAEGAAPVVAAGAVEVSWSGGSPEEDHAGARTWWTVPAGQGRFRVVVALSGPTTVRVRLGTSGVSAAARPTLTAEVTGTARPGSASVPVDAAFTEAAVRVPDGAAGATLTLIFSSGRDVGVLGLSTVSVG